jgi:hypothetical protein
MNVTSRHEREIIPYELNQLFLDADQQDSRHIQSMEIPNVTEEVTSEMRDIPLAVTKS